MRDWNPGYDRREIDKHFLFQPIFPLHFHDMEIQHFLQRIFENLSIFQASNCQSHIEGQDRAKSNFKAVPNSILKISDIDKRRHISVQETRQVDQDFPDMFQLRPMVLGIKTWGFANRAKISKQVNLTLTNA